MTTNTSKSNQYDFTGIPIDELISKPLTAIVDAQSKMAREQVKLLLQNCFTFNGEFYQPKVIKMCITRAVIEQRGPDKPPELEQIITFFDLPLISIFPFNSLGIEAVDIHFDIDISTQYTIEIDWENIPSDTDQASSFNTDHDTEVQMLGKVTSSAFTNKKKTESISSDSSYSVDVVAAPLPLPPGLLSIIDVYTKAIEPTQMPEIEN